MNLKNKIAAATLAVAGITGGANAQSHTVAFDTQTAADKTLSADQIANRESMISGEVMNKLAFQTEINGSNIHGGIEYNKLRGSVLKFGLARMVGDNGAMAIDFRVGKNEKEILAQLGYQFTEGTMAKVFFASQKQLMEFVFPSGTENVMMSQNTIGAALRIKGDDVIKFFEVAGYHINAKGNNFGAKEYFIDTPTLYQLFSDPRIVAGSRTNGIEGTIHLILSEKNKLALEISTGIVGRTHQTLSSTPTETNGTLGAKFIFPITSAINGHVAIRHESSGSNRVTLGTTGKAMTAELYTDTSNGTKNIGGILRYNVHLHNDLSPATEGRTSRESTTDSYVKQGVQKDRHQSVYSVQYSDWIQKNPNWTPSETSSTPIQKTPSYRSDMMKYVQERGGFIPTTIFAKIDPTALPKLLVQIDKSVLPPGSKIDTATGITSIALPGEPGILMGAMNTSSSIDIIQAFSIVGNTLIFNPKAIEGSLIPGTNIVTIETSNYIVDLIIMKGSVQLTGVAISSKVIDAPTIGDAPGVSNLTPFSFDATVNISDTDGVRDLSCQLQTALGVNIGTSIAPRSGKCSFVGLTPATTYKIITTGQVAQKDTRGNIAWVTISKSSSFTTLATTAPTTSFASNISKIIGDPSFVQLLTTNSPGVVTYTSANPNIATVNATTGLVTLLMAGSTTIIANQAASGNFGGSTASYTLTVGAAGVDSPTTVTLAASNITTTSALAACNIVDLDGVTGNCTLTGGAGATTWPIGANRSLTGLAPGTTYTITIAGTKNIKNPNNSLSTVAVNQVVSFTTTIPPDTTPPVITLNGSTTMNIVQGASYIESGASCMDNRDSSCTVVVTGSVNTAVVGNYTITYRATDAAGNVSTADRTVNVTLAPDTTPPVITLNGSDTIYLTVGDTYIEQGASCTDNRSSCTVTRSSTNVNTATAGNYTVVYTATDTSGNSTTRNRSVVVSNPVVVPPDPVVCPPGLAPDGLGGCG